MQSQKSNSPPFSTSQGSAGRQHGRTVTRTACPGRPMVRSDGQGSTGRGGDRQVGLVEIQRERVEICARDENAASGTVARSRVKKNLINNIKNLIEIFSYYHGFLIIFI